MVELRTLAVCVGLLVVLAGGCGGGEHEPGGAGDPIESLARQAALVADIVDQCEAEHDIYVVGAWGIQMGSRLTERSYTFVASCMRDAGVDIGGTRDIEDLRDAVGPELERTLFDCVDGSVEP